MKTRFNYFALTSIVQNLFISPSFVSELWIETDKNFCNLSIVKYANDQTLKWVIPFLQTRVEN